ncbi:hypothetical protein [Trichloromonas sp.]
MNKSTRILAPLLLYLATATGAVCTARGCLFFKEARFNIHM